MLRGGRPACVAVAAMTKRIKIASTVRRALIIVGSKRGDILGSGEGALPQSRPAVDGESNNSDDDYESRDRAKGWHGRKGGKLSQEGWRPALRLFKVGCVAPKIKDCRDVT